MQHCSVLNRLESRNEVGRKSKQNAVTTVQSRKDEVNNKRLEHCSWYLPPDGTQRSWRRTAKRRETLRWTWLCIDRPSRCKSSRSRTAEDGVTVNERPIVGPVMGRRCWRRTFVHHTTWTRSCHCWVFVELQSVVYSAGRGTKLL